MKYFLIPALIVILSLSTGCASAGTYFKDRALGPGIVVPGVRVVPDVDNGQSREEWKAEVEANKIMGRTTDLIPSWYDVMAKLQRFVTIQKLNTTRVSGMTYEPSSFADQLIVIWLPWVLGASLEDYTVFKWRWKWITIERILFIWTAVILAFTLSRTGLVLGVGVIGFGFLLKIFGPQHKTQKEKEELDKLEKKYKKADYLTGKNTLPTEALIEDGIVEAEIHPLKEKCFETQRWTLA